VAIKMWNAIHVDYDEIKQGNLLLNKVIKGKSPAIVINNFYSQELCKKITDKIKNVSKFDYETGIMKHIGIFLMSYVYSKQDYFKNAKKSEKKIKQLFHDVEDPRIKIQKVISQFFPIKNVTVAREKNNYYSNGIIRIHEKGDCAPLHRDNVSFEAPQFFVSKLTNQLSCVLYLQQSEGGELIIYKKKWNEIDQKFREIGFGYSRKVLENISDSVSIYPNPGDLVILNPNYFHEVTKVSGKQSRVTLGVFLAFSDINHVMMWS